MFLRNTSIFSRAGRAESQEEAEPESQEEAEPESQEEAEPESEEGSTTDSAYEQWVSMETPNVRLDNEEPLDEFFAFHRCLEVLSDFLRVHYFVYNDTSAVAGHVCPGEGFPCGC
jgi:hypothetical protein